MGNNWCQGDRHWGDQKSAKLKHEAHSRIVLGDRKSDKTEAGCVGWELDWYRVMGKVLKLKQDVCVIRIQVGTGDGVYCRT